MQGARFKKLSIETPPERTEAKESTVNSSGTFSEADVRISKKGLHITSSPCVQRPIKKSTDGESEATIEELEELIDLGEKLGSGASATVRKAMHAPTKQIVALKVIAMDVTPETRRNVLLELRTLHESSHPSIVSFFGAFYKEGSVYIALEYMDCGSLLDIVENVGCIPEAILAKISAQLFRGIGYIHKQLHIVHRDIKPANILVNSAGEVKIADFGVSGKMASTVGTKQTFIGTMTYMSPERIRGTSHSSNSDVWSMGLSILQCAIGYYPYYSDSKKAPGTFFELLELIQNTPSPRLPSDRFSPEFCNFIAQCLKKDPHERPSSIELLKHPFLAKCSQNDADVAAWIKSALTSMGKLKKQSETKESAKERKDSRESIKEVKETKERSSSRSKPSSNNQQEPPSASQSPPASHSTSPSTNAPIYNNPYPHMPSPTSPSTSAFAILSMTASATHGSGKDSVFTGADASPPASPRLNSSSSPSTSKKSSSARRKDSIKEKEKDKGKGSRSSKKKGSKTLQQRSDDDRK